LGAVTFLKFTSFWTNFNGPDVPTGRVQVLFGHQKQRSLPSGSGLPLALKVFDHQPVYLIF